MKRLLAFLLGLTLMQAGAQIAPEYYVKHLVFPAGCPPAERIALAARLVPSASQLVWQRMELTAFLHFGINTFTDREWGDGTEDPKLFNPTDFDAGQWIRTLRDAGFRMVILTAKHHDGFCLWPTRTTRHSVAASPWKGGRGDVVREVRDACDRYGMKFGVYLSPWDRNAPCYGDSPAYNRFFVEQLEELLGNYGRVDEVWFDGANGEGPDGRKQVYDWEAFYRTIRRLQPDAVTAVMGDDVRWVGNEKGLGRETEWSATVLTPGIYARAQENNARLGIRNEAKDLGSRAMLEKATELFWYPSEVDVSIRPGWFYHPDQDGQVKSLRQLADIYFSSVGCNSVLLLNIPPDTRGRIHEADSARLQQFARYLKETFADDRVLGGSEAWTASEGAARTYALRPSSRINVVMVQEQIARGQRVERFSLEAHTATGWQPLCSGTTIGHKRLLRFPAVEASELRLRIDSTRAEATICRVGAFYAEPLPDQTQHPIRNDLPRQAWRIVERQPLIVDLGRTAALEAFTYAPADAEARADMAFRYRFATSADAVTWQTVIADGEFSNIMHNPLPQTVALGRRVVARFIRLEATSPGGTTARIAPEELSFACARPAAPDTAALRHVLLFSPGDCGSKHYRIPALITAADGSVIAVADRRHDSSGDLPNRIDLVLRRSTDNGLTWSRQMVIASHSGDRGFGDAALVVDRRTGDLLCIFASGCGLWASTADRPMDICIARSRDNGQTWSAPRPITPQIYGPDCDNPAAAGISGLFAASGRAEQLGDGTLAFVVAAHRTGERWPPLYNYVCLSDDGGKNWRLLPATPGAVGDEAKLVERTDGSWLMSIRNPAKGHRRYALSRDRGATWSEAGTWSDLPDPACNGDCIRYSACNEGHGRDRLLHSIPADTALRRNVSVALSYDEGLTWPVRKTVWEGPAGYSSLTRLADGAIGLLTEVPREDGSHDIWFTRLSMAWLTDGADGGE